MNLNFDRIRNQKVIIEDNCLTLGDHNFRFADELNLGDRFGTISAQALAQALEQILRLTHGSCYPQFGALVFTATGNHRALDLYFPILQMLTESEMDEFYRLVGYVASHPNFDLRLTDDDWIDRTAQIPSSVTHLVAGQIVEVFFYRRDILTRFFTHPRHIELYTNLTAFKQSGGMAGGDYNPQRESIQLILARLFEGFFGPTAGVCPFLHEFGHMLDHFDAATGQMGRSEGLLPGLHPDDGDLFRPRARQLFIVGKRLELEHYLAWYQGIAKGTDPLPIGHPYVFQNDGEFIAGYFEMFFRNSNYFAAQNPDLYASFAELFGYDPRRAWHEDFPLYVEQNRSFYLSGQQPWVPHLTVPQE